MLSIAIDGACRRNGKPDCTSAGGIFVAIYSGVNELVDTRTFRIHEHKSTSQRGEMLALLEALSVVSEQGQDAQIITDSEYLFNTMTKEWYKSWAKRGWVTSTGEPVKNQDLWKQIAAVKESCEHNEVDVTFYHIKGHTMSFGKVTAAMLLDKDSSGYALYTAVLEKAKTVALKDGMYEVIHELSLKNNGYALPDEVLQRFIVANTVADAVATSAVEIADAARPTAQP